MRSKGLIEERCEQLFSDKFESTSQEIFLQRAQN